MARGARAGGPLSLGKARAKIQDESSGNELKFADVAGVDEAKTELVEIVDAAYGRVKTILRQRHEDLKRLTAELVRKETLERAELEALVSIPAPAAVAVKGAPDGLC